MTVSGSAIVNKLEALGKAAAGYSETTDGGVGPQYYDCSGLVQKTLTDLGITGVPRTSEQQWAWLQSAGAAHTGVPTASDLSPGDLVFANFGNEVSPGHVGIYVGNGQVYSAQDVSAGIGLSSLSSWGSNVVGWGTPPGATGGPASANLTSSIIPGLGDLGSIASGLSGVVTDMDDIAKVFVDLSQPSFWLRIGMFFAGVGLLGWAVWIMMGRPTPNIVPVPV
jgi:hypothetical protein